jgi:hypothetical protein
MKRKANVRASEREKGNNKAVCWPECHKWDGRGRDMAK